VAFCFAIKHSLNFHKSGRTLWALKLFIQVKIANFYYDAELLQPSL